jgi:hypothetical protein
MILWPTVDQVKEIHGNNMIYSGTDVGLKAVITIQNTDVLMVEGHDDKMTHHTLVVEPRKIKK